MAANGVGGGYWKGTDTGTAAEVQSFPFWQQKGRTNFAGAILVPVSFWKQSARAELGLADWAQLNLRSDCCQETFLGSNLL